MRRSVPVVLVLLLTALSARAAYAQEPILEQRPETPGFRTDLGIHLAGGGHQCLRGGGSGYAECRTTDYGWSTSYGFAAGFLVRPLRFLSVGIDVAYMNMECISDDFDWFSDLTVGPAVRGHLPIRIVEVVLEPSLGAQGGVAVGFLSEGSHVHRHYGPFFSALFDLDLFVVPSFGFGFELRITGVFYQEVCFESSEGVLCRGTEDESLIRSNDEGTRYFPGDTGKGEYPWKIFYGGHLVYYF